MFANLIRKRNESSSFGKDFVSSSLGPNAAFWVADRAGCACWVGLPLLLALHGEASVQLAGQHRLGRALHWTLPDLDGVHKRRQGPRALPERQHPRADSFPKHIGVARTELPAFGLRLCPQLRGQDQREVALRQRDHGSRPGTVRDL